MKTRHPLWRMPILFFIFGVVLLFCACADRQLVTTGSLTLTVFDGTVRTLVPQDYSVVSYHVTGSGVLGQTLDKIQDSQVFNFENLAGGVWNIQIEGLDAANNVMLRGVVKVIIIPGQHTAETVGLVQSAGSGSLSLNISWPVDKSIVGISAKLVSADDSQNILRLEFSTYGATASCFVSSIATGSWTLTATVDFGPGTRRVIIADEVQIFSGKATGGSFFLTANDLYEGFFVLYMNTGSDGGTVPVDDYVYASDGTGIALVKGTTGSLTRTGYILSGWNTQEDSAGIDYAAGNPIPVAQNLVLYPVWLDEQVLTIAEGGNLVDCRYTYEGHLILPEEVTSVGDYAFYQCKQLEGITLPAGITSIGVEAFGECLYIESITLPAGMTTISDQAFMNCYGLESIQLPERITRIEDYVFNSCWRLNDVVLPTGITSIGDGAFGNCSSLVNLTLPDTLTSIGEGAFKFCIGLETVTLPTGVTSIGDEVFSYCIGLVTVTLPYGISSVGHESFMYCTSLENINLPNSVSSIGDYAFWGCSRLVRIDLSERLTKLGSSAFVQCTSLVEVHLPEGLAAIGSSAFSGCYSLISITLPQGLTELGDQVFANCINLAEVILNSPVPPEIPALSQIFENTSADLLIRVPAGTVDAYKTASGWSEYASRIVSQ